jgi:PKD repeat protein
MEGFPMSRRLATAALLAALALSGLLTTSAAAETALPLPDRMAAVGDSITQAASTAGSLGVDAPQNSWATGTTTSVNSHYLRLLALGAPISGANHNLSVSGAKVAGLSAQMQNAVTLQPDYLTVLIGGNDICTDTVAEMTSVATFRAQFEAAMATLTSGSPDTHVYVVSIPDVYQLWALFKSDFWARFIWSVGDICQSLLANPTSTQQVDVERRQQVRQRNIDFNTQLAEACAAYVDRCRYDNNAIFNTQFVRSDVSGDYFHPSTAGQAKLASVSWAAGYAWTAAPPPNVAPSAAFTSSCVDLTCTFTDTSTDPDGTIAGRSWAFGDGGSSTAASVSHTYVAAGTFLVVLTVTDDAGASASASTSLAVSAPSEPTPMWIGNLTGSTTASRNIWTATVRIAVVGPGPVSGVAVTGQWSTGSGASGCTTGSDGTCAVTSSTLNKKTTSVTFTVNDLALDGWFYDPASNAVSSSIPIAKP